jgi:hypothetical protein
VGLFNDDVMLGSRTAIGPYVAHHRPLVIVLNALSVAVRPSILPVIAEYYVAVYRAGPDTIYVERSSLPHGIPAAARRHAHAGSAV